MISKLSKQRLFGVNDSLIALFDYATSHYTNRVEIADKGGIRTQAEQVELYSKGRTKPGNKVTNADGVNKLSKHQQGLAIDIVIYVQGKPKWDFKYYNEFATIMKNEALKRGLKLIWGGTFKSRIDAPHFEIEL